MSLVLNRTKDELLADFRVTFDSFVYPQPLVAKVIGAAQTDLNTWRSRGFVGIGVDEGTRVTYTGRGLIHAGIVNELAIFFGPKRAAQLSEQLMGHVEAYRNPLSGPWVIRFDRSFNTDGTPASHERELVMSMGHSDSFVFDADRTTLTFPIDRLVEGWTIMARLATAANTKAVA